MTYQIAALLFTSRAVGQLFAGADLGGFVGFEQTPLSPRIIRLTVPLLLPPVLVTQQIFSE